MITEAQAKTALKAVIETIYTSGISEVVEYELLPTRGMGGVFRDGQSFYRFEIAGRTIQYQPVDGPEFMAEEEEYAFAVEPTLETRLEAEARSGMEAMLTAIETLLGESSSLPEFQAKLAVAYPDLDGAEVQRVLGQALFANRLAGIFEAQEGG
ncbi:MAG: hypothetical protein OHK0012_11620 [Synechococcales cyanobacterium]